MTQAKAGVVVLDPHPLLLLTMLLPQSHSCALIKVIVSMSNGDQLRSTVSLSDTAESQLCHALNASASLLSAPLP